METPGGSRSASEFQTPSRSSPSPTPSVSRLWRPAAQRNLRNQWQKLVALRSQWISASSNGRAHATALVNAYLSLKYMPSMELGILRDMPDIQKKACAKLIKQLKLHHSNLLSSYKDMVSVVKQMVSISRSMRCYVKGTTSSPLVQFSNSSEDSMDNGDGGGIPVFIFLSISSFEQLAEELVHMFISELNLKRLLMMELLNSSSEDPRVDALCSSDELYPGEFDDLSVCNLYDKENGELIPPSLIEGKTYMCATQLKNQPNREILQVYLTTWLAEVNVDGCRMDEIFAIIGEEMHVSLS